MTNVSSAPAIGLTLEDKNVRSEDAEVESWTPEEPTLKGHIGEAVAATETVSEPEDQDSFVEQPPVWPVFRERARTPSKQRIASALSFDADDEDTLRATSFRTVLHRGSRILQSSAGSEADYRLSRSVKMIDVFISHNWVVPRRKKFWALVLHFNIAYAMLGSYAGVALGCLLNILAVPPTLQTADHALRPYCLILGTCGFFLALSFGHDLPCFGRLLCQQSVFLDKVCIHQTDPDLKAAGVKKIGAFLNHSKRMLVLFNNVYCKKLWTVYEVACFMYVHPMEKVELVPVDIAGVVLQSTAIGVIAHLASIMSLHFASDLGDISSSIQLVCVVGFGFVSMAAFAFMLRQWALRQSELFSDLRDFQIEKASCADERDRALVSSNICSFVRAMGLAPVGTSDELALVSFDTLVQTSMPEWLRSAIGRIGFPYKYAFVAGTAIDFYTFDVISSQQDVSPLFVVTWLMHCINLRAVVVPSVFLVCAWISNTCPPQGVWAEVAVTLGAAMLSTLVAGVLYGLSLFLREQTVQSAWLMPAYVLATAVQTFVVARLFSWRPPTTQRVEAPEETV